MTGFLADRARRRSRMRELLDASESLSGYFPSPSGDLGRDEFAIAVEVDTIQAAIAGGFRRSVLSEPAYVQVRASLDRLAQRRDSMNASQWNALANLDHMLVK